MARDRKPARHRHRHLCDRGRFPRSGQMFAALAVPNFPLYLAGQAVSLTGTWMAPGPGRSPSRQPRSRVLHWPAPLGVGGLVPRACAMPPWRNAVKE